MGASSKIHDVVREAKLAYDRMLETNTFNSEKLDKIFSVFQAKAAPVDQTAHRVPNTTIPIYVFNFCIFVDTADSVELRGHKNSDERIPIHQISGTFFPNHPKPLYLVTDITLPLNVARLSRKNEKVNRDIKIIKQGTVKSSSSEKMTTIVKKKRWDGAQVDLVSVTILEPTEKPHEYRYKQVPASKKFFKPERNGRKPQFTRSSLQGKTRSRQLDHNDTLKTQPKEKTLETFTKKTEQRPTRRGKRVVTTHIRV